ncbi:MAG: hypothetical protein Q7S68_05785 [Deltaproteobacteria bacterium]|nr:hypothetical protein [Deltaproteobacteria bacterium]
MSILRKYFWIFLIGFWVVACGDKKPSALPTDPTENGDPFNLDIADQVIFPHVTDWASSTVHGTYVRKNGFTVCLNCHKTESTVAEQTPTCSSCHSVFPHPSGWKNFEGHGQFVTGILHGNMSLCQTCHTTSAVGSTPAFCNTCHASYPNRENWGNANQHGPAAYGLGKLSCASSNCHGINFSGSAQAPSCYNCHGQGHTDYPHTSSKWMNPDRTSHAANRDENFHGDRFIRKIQRGETAPCAECHGVNYDLSPGGARQCISCHTLGVSHRTAPNGVLWNSGHGHGRYFSTQFNANSTNANCEHCHGAATGFNASQTQTILTSVSDCYQCHAAYPHRSHTISPITWQWEPMIDNCGSATGNIAHQIYMMMPDGSQLFTTPTGVRPRGDDSDPSNLSAIQHTCGGSEAGSCHFNGKRSYRLTRNGGLCGSTCHNPNNPDLIPPPVRTCPPGPIRPVCPAGEELCSPEEGNPFCYNPSREPDQCPQ